MTLPLEITLANILSLCTALIAVYAVLISRRAQVSTTTSTKLQEIETYYGERIALLQDQRKADGRLIDEVTAKAEFFKNHAIHCEEQLEKLDQRLREMERFRDR